MKYSKEQLKEQIIQKLRLTFGCTEEQATDGDMMKACAMVLRDIMAQRGVETRRQTGRPHGPLYVPGVSHGPQPHEERL